MAPKNVVQKAQAARANAALKAEAEGEAKEPIDLTIKVNGEDVTFTVPASIEDASVDVLFNLEDEKPLAAFRALLGEEGVQRMREAGATGRDFTRFISEWTEAAGLGN